MISPISGYQPLDHPGASGVARPEAVPWCRYVLEGGDTLHAAAGADREAIALEGRAPVYVIPAKIHQDRVGDGSPRWAVRRFARGGRILPRLLEDRFLRLGTPRPFHEVQVSEGARARSIPTPRVMAAMMYPHGLFYRADLVTEYVPDTTDLVESIFDVRRKGPGGAVERLDALKAAGLLIRTMARAGLRHEDLHAGNILLQWTGAAPRALILDLDRSRLIPPGGTAHPEAMLRRLRRSLRKWERRTGLRISTHEWSALDAAVMG